jgi:hypothetical protein
MPYLTLHLHSYFVKFNIQSTFEKIKSIKHVKNTFTFNCIKA